MHYNLTRKFCSLVHLDSFYTGRYGSPWVSVLNTGYSRCMQVYVSLQQTLFAMKNASKQPEAIYEACAEKIEQERRWRCFTIFLFTYLAIDVKVLIILYFTFYIKRFHYKESINSSKKTMKLKKNVNPRTIVNTSNIVFAVAVVVCATYYYPIQTVCHSEFSPDLHVSRCNLLPSEINSILVMDWMK